MARPIWSGSISFGLVNIPIKAYTATRDRSVHFHWLHDQDHSRVRRKLVSESSGKEVHPEHIVKGYEIGKDQYVIVEQREIEACAPEKTRAIEITDFVDLSEIDPMYYESPYYLLPEPGAVKAYRLLLDAMTKSKKVGLAKMVMHNKEHLAALRPKGELICLETMRLADEIVSPKDVGEVGDVKVSDRELKAAENLVDSLSTSFDPKKYRDEYRDCIMEVVEKKSRGEEIHARAPKAPKGERAANLMEALQASLAAAKAAHGTNGSRRRKSA